MPPNPAPGINPVALTYHPSPTSTKPPTSPTANKKSSANTFSSPIPHPPSISTETYHIAGILTTIHGLAELPPTTTRIAVLWLLHPRLQTQECMHPFAADIINAWNEKARRTGSTKGLIAVSFDQRNHGTREVHALANEAWRGGNERHAQDMFGQYNGTVRDTMMLMDYLGAYIFLDQKEEVKREIVQNLVLGISLGGHAAWQLLMRDGRVGSAVVVIGCPDYESLMRDRARLSKRKSWREGRWEGSEDWSGALAEMVRMWDPVGVVWGALGRRVNHTEQGELSRKEEKELRPLMERCFGGKRLMCLSGSRDKLVPYKMGEPFLRWLKRVSGQGGFFENGDLVLEDVVIDDCGHEVPPVMIEPMKKFMVESLEKGKELGVSRRPSRESRI